MIQNVKPNVQLLEYWFIPGIAILVDDKLESIVSDFVTALKRAKLILFLVG